MPINPTPLKDEKKEKAEKKKDKFEFNISEPLNSFEDVVLDDDTYEEIHNALGIIQFKDKLFNEWNLSSVIKKNVNLCINLYGYPGTGKTMVAHAIANELNLKILQINYADVESKYVGETSKNLMKIFEYAEKNNVLILFDEADALLSKRVVDMHSATDVSVNQTRSVLLTLLDKFGGMVIFTTNFISNYDSAFMRRIPYHIKFGLPNEEVRNKLLNHYLKDTVPNNIDIPYIAHKYDGITGSDISTALLTSALKTARMRNDLLIQDDFEKALSNILKSKKANQLDIRVEEREVSKEYVLSKLAKKGVE